MIIKELHLIAFGKFHNKIVKFDEGLNLVSGENEAGKSTMHKFIEGMFFGFFKPYSKNKIYTFDYERCLPWSGSDYKGAIVYEHGDRTYRLERNFLKGKEWVKLYDHKSNEDLTYTLDFDATAKIPKANKHINITSVMFKNTASIGQMGNPTGEELTREIGDLFVNASGTYSAGISLNKALDILNEEKKALGTKKRSKSPYGRDVKELESLKEQRNDIVYEIEENKKKYVQAKEFEKELTILKEQKDNITSLRDNISHIKAISKYEKYMAAKEESDSLKEEIDASPIIAPETERSFKSANEKMDIAEAKVFELEDKLLSEQTQYKALKDSADVLGSTIMNYDFTQVAADESVLLQKTEQLNKHREKQNQEAGNTDVYKKYKTYQKNEKTFSKMALSLGVLFLISGTLGLLIDSRFFYITAVLSVGVAGSFAVWMSAKSKRQQIQPEYERFDTLMSRTTNMMLMCELDIDALVKKYSCSDARELLDLFVNINETKTELENINKNLIRTKANIDSIKNDIAENEREINECLEVINDIYEAVGCEDGESFYALLEQSNKREVLSAKYDSVIDKIDHILDGEDIFDLQNRYETAINLNISAEMDNEEEIARELDNINDEILRITAESSDLISAIKRSEDNMTALNAVCEKISALEEAIKDYDDEIKAYDIAIDEIEFLSKEIRSSFSEEFNTFISKTVSDITNGKYSDVVVNEDLKMMVMDKEHSQLVDMSSLSGGTIDQLYFAMRFAIMDLVLSDRTIPVFLDDCFTQYDDRRLLNVLKFLHKRSSDRQIIIFTCRNQERDCLEEMDVDYNYIRM